MDIQLIQTWIDANPWPAFGALMGLSLVTFLITRFVIARGLIYLAERTETKYDDIIVEHLKPYSISYVAPLLLIYGFAYVLPEYTTLIKDLVLFLILWVIAITIIRLLNALNTIYESAPSFTGVSIQGYLDIVKLIVILVALILSISMLTGQSPIVLLSGLGALTAVLLLVFQNTILSLVSSVQIATNDLVKEGEWIEVPSFDADGDVIDISLHAIKIQNWDKTISYIPTYKLTDTAFKNWRGMQDSGGRRIKRSLFIDQASIKFCDAEMLQRFQQIELLKPYLDSKLVELESAKSSDRQLTNVGTFRAYMEVYLRSREDIHQQGLTFLIRQLAPSPTGLPLEVYVFTKTTEWAKYEHIQADIFDHLLATASRFDLRIFQNPTGMDFSNLAAHRHQS
ncbi:MAG: mechanosensitive ion channel family protein [Chloroflexota bacterium]